jgi:hypothetical protein
MFLRGLQFIRMPNIMIIDVVLADFFRNYEIVIYYYNISTLVVLYMYYYVITCS